MKIIWIIALALFVATGCGKKDDSASDKQSPQPAVGAPVQTQPAGAATPKAPTPATGDSQPAGDATAASPDNPGDGDELPTAEDFEEEVSAEITAENLDAELKKLEEELGE